MKIKILNQFKNVIETIKEATIGEHIFIEIQQTNLFFTLNKDVAIFINLAKSTPDEYKKFLMCFEQLILNKPKVQKYFYDIKSITRNCEKMLLNYTVDDTWNDFKSYLIIHGDAINEYKMSLYGYEDEDICKRRGKLANKVYSSDLNNPVKAYTLTKKCIPIYMNMEQRGVKLIPFEHPYYHQIKPFIIDGIFHPSFTLVGDKGTRTGSNFFNFPKEHRTAIVAREGYVLTEYDYNCAEARIIAHLSKDRALYDVFDNGKDLHIENAKIMLSKAKPTKSERELAKEVYFSWINGMSINALSKTIDLEFKDTRILFNKLKKHYKKTVSWIEKVQNKAIKDGYVENLFGRRRQITLDKKNEARSKRQASSFVVQSTLTDFKLMALIKIDSYMKNILLGERTDSILVEVLDDEHTDKVLNKIKDIMEQPIPKSKLNIPTKVQEGLHL